MENTNGVILTPHAIRGLYYLRSPYRESLIDFVKNKNGQRWPGSYWDKEKRAWIVAEEAVENIAEFSAKLGLDVSVQPRLPVFQEEPIWPEDLKLYQKKALARVNKLGILVMQWEMGIGKTRVVIEFSKKLPGTTIVIAPQKVLLHWESQIHKWYPEVEESAIHRIRQGKQFPTELPKFILCSYGMVHHIPPGLHPSILAFDEMHSLIHGTSQQSQSCRELSLQYPHAIRFGLTGTPVSAHMSNLHSQLDILCPGRFGTYNQWVNYYHVCDNLGYEGHRRIHGLREDRVPELVQRLESVCDIISQGDIISLSGNSGGLPEVTWKRESMGSAPFPTSSFTLQNWKKEQQKLAGARSGAVAPFAPVSGPSAPNTIFITYLRKTCAMLAERLRCPAVDGGMSIKKRLEALQDAPLAVVTMRSINEGIELPQFTNVFVVETFPVPLFMTQVIARFIRLGQQKPVTITFLEFDNTSDQMIAEKILTRIQENDKLMRSGKVQTSLKDMLSIKMDDDSFLAELRAAFSTKSVSPISEEYETDIWDDDEDDG